MFQNYLLSASRNILKHKLYTFINVVGLAIGIAACIMIVLFVRSELTFDKGIKDAENIYRLESRFTPPGRSPVHTSQASGKTKFGLSDDFPELSNMTRFFFSGEETLVRRGENFFYESLMFADSNYLSFFDLPLISGNKETALSDTSSVILSETMAHKYFGTEHPIGKIITITVLGEKRDYEVTAVVEDLPKNSHMKMDIAIYLDDNQFAFNPNYSERWMATNMYVYFNIPDNIPVQFIESRFPEFIDIKATPEIREFGMTLESANLMAEWTLVKLSDIHIFSAPLAAMKPRGSLTNLISFSAIAVVILIIAIINFTNLSTARSAARAKEVNMRKVMGARRRQIIWQLLVEANLLTLASVIIALAFIESTLPAYNAFLDKDISLGLLENPLFGIGYFSFSLIIGTITGLYPAFQLSAHRPGKALQATKSSVGGSSIMGSVLVILQFAASITLFIATATVYNQTSYARGLDTGYKTDGIMIIQGLRNPELYPNLEAFKNEINNNPEIKSSSLSLRTPGQEIFGATRANLPDSNDRVVVTMMPIDFDFFKTYEIDFLAGRDLNIELQSDYIRPLSGIYQNGNAVLNETAIRRFGFKDANDAIGKEFRMLADTSDTSKVVTITIAGVVPDMIINSTREAINPSVYFVDVLRYSQLSINFSSPNIKGLMENTHDVWNKFVPDIPFRTVFLDEKIASLYDNEEATSQVFAIFAALAILVSTLGLYGLAGFVTERRTKEIGIRKVLGAGIRDILQILLWQFSKPVLIANLIAWPIAWYLMSDWLNGFEHRISMNPFLFIGVGVIALMIAWATVIKHTTKVARTNPIKALRYE